MPTRSLKSDLQARRKVIAATILFVGIALGTILYVRVPPAQDDLLREEEEASKVYQRQMEMYGGKANVFASQVRDWFTGLWHGKTLGVTVACLSALVALAVFLALTPLPPYGDSPTPPDTR